MAPRLPRKRAPTAMAAVRLGHDFHDQSVHLQEPRLRSEEDLAPRHSGSAPSRTCSSSTVFPARNLASSRSMRNRAARPHYASAGNGSSMHLASESTRDDRNEDGAHSVRLTRTLRPRTPCPTARHLHFLLGRRYAAGACGQLCRGIATLAASRSSVLPDVPTTRDAPRLKRAPGYTVMAPAGVAQSRHRQTQQGDQCAFRRMRRFASG